MFYEILNFYLGGVKIGGNKRGKLLKWGYEGKETGNFRWNQLTKKPPINQKGIYY